MVIYTKILNHTMAVLLLVLVFVFSMSACNYEQNDQNESYTPSDSAIMSNKSGFSNTDDVSSNIINSKESSTQVSEEQKNNDTSEPSSSVSEHKSESKVEYIYDIDTSSTDISKWYLALVNSENIIPEENAPTVTFIKNVNLKFHSKAVSALNAMIAYAKDDGVSLGVSSAYRTIGRQTTLYNNKVRSYINNGFDEDEALQVAATEVARPGTSEHNLGLAVDFYPVSSKFEQSREYKWLSKNAEQYGFIMRYPRHKKDITKIIFEPWHYRFVGREHAAFMNDNDMCLEEYIDYLKTK